MGTRDGLGGGWVVATAVAAAATMAAAADAADVVVAVVDCKWRLSKEVRDNLTTRPLGVVSIAVIDLMGRELEERGEREAGEEGED